MIFLMGIMMAYIDFLDQDSHHQQRSKGRNTPLTSCRFGIEINNTVVGIFKCSGFQTEIEEYSYREGGMNRHLHILPGRTKYQHIVLKQGVTISSTLWDWYQQSLRSRKDIRRNVSIILFNEKMEEARRWNFKGCWPKKWVGPDLSAVTSNVAIETFVIAHEGFIEESSVFSQPLIDANGNELENNIV